MPPRPERVAVLACEDVVPFNLAVPGPVFGSPVAVTEGLYDVVVCAADDRVPTSDGYDVGVARGLEAVAAADLVIVPGTVGAVEVVRPEVVDALQAAHARGARVASLCTGAFVLAAAGLLDGRRVTTHWGFAAELARRCPTATVEPDVLFCDEGAVLSSAGLAAGIDLCLHIVARSHGAEVANRCARFLVAAPHRAGGQAQYIERPVPEAGESPLARTRRFMLDHLDAPLTVDGLAADAAMSRRTFTRQFRAETGQSPMDWLLDQRIAHARLLLETSDDSVHHVARRAGLGTDAALRHHFRRVLGTSPTDYRRTFHPA